MQPLAGYLPCVLARLSSRDGRVRDTSTCSFSCSSGDVDDRGAEVRDALRRNTDSVQNTAAPALVPAVLVRLRYETYGRASAKAFALLNDIAKYAAGIESVSMKLCMEDVMCDLSPGTLCWGAARHVIASMPLQARLGGRAVLPVLVLQAVYCLSRLMAFDDAPNMQPCKCVPGGVRSLPNSKFGEPVKLAVKLLKTLGNASARLWEPLPPHYSLVLAHTRKCKCE